MGLPCGLNVCEDQLRGSHLDDVARGQLPRLDALAVHHRSCAASEVENHDSIAGEPCDGVLAADRFIGELSPDSTTRIAAIGLLATSVSSVTNPRGQTGASIVEMLERDGV
jgi:hypothetical protein